MGERKWKRREFEMGGEKKVEKERVLNLVGRKKRKRGRKSGKEVGRKVEKMRKKGERDGREELERGRKEWGGRRRG